MVLLDTFFNSSPEGLLPIGFYQNLEVISRKFSLGLHCKLDSYRVITHTKNLFPKLIFFRHSVRYFFISKIDNADKTTCAAGKV